MARIIYALSGQGRGHASRVLAVSEALRERGHELLFCCGGTARDVFDSLGEPVVPVPALRQVMEGNRVQVLRTLHCNRRHVLHRDDIASDLADAFRDFGADLLVNDFEAFSHRAAARLNLPVVSLNHQQVVTETDYSLPLRYALHALLAKAAINLIAPPEPELTLLTSFFFPPLRHPGAQTALIPPIIRRDVQALTPTTGDRVLVYFNQPDGARSVLDVLRKVDASFVVYNFDPPADPADYPNLTFKEPSITGFLDDLATCRAVVCTAGFTLISEALFLGKPLLVVPNRGIFEQTLNALFLQRDGLGHAVVERTLTQTDVAAFLDAGPDLTERLRGRDACGNNDAIERIEGVLLQLAPPRVPRPALSCEDARSTPLAPPVNPD